MQQTNSLPNVEPDDEWDSKPAPTLHPPHQQQDTLQYLTPGTILHH
jgi:hypothetical protein